MPTNGKKRVAFVTVGQSPRDDILPEILPLLGPGIEAIEVGALDGMSREEIAQLAPVGDERRLCTRLRDGTEVVTTKAWTRDHLQRIMDNLDADGVDLIVLLCTGYFDGLESRTLMVEAQRVVDHMVAALAEGDRRVGVMVPLAAQTTEFKQKGVGPAPARVTHASPYAENRLAEAAGELADSDFIVMHCMGYTEDMRRQVAAASGRPVLLARRVVADAVAQLL